MCRILKRDVEVSSSKEAMCERRIMRRKKEFSSRFNMGASGLQRERVTA